MLSSACIYQASVIQTLLPAMHDLEHQELERHIRALVDRQARAWERNDFSLAAGDWCAGGMLVSPGGVVPDDELAAVMAAYHARFEALTVEITNLFVAADGRQAAVEWLWTVTRRRDGARGTTSDAILVELEDGKIRSWREYFNLLGSVELDT